MKLSVPFNGDFEGLKEIIKNASSDVYEVFVGGSPYYMGSIRGHFRPDQHIEDITEQTAYVHEHGIRMTIVVNATCLGGRHMTAEGNKMFRWYLDKLNDIGVDAIMASDPYLIELVSKEYDMEAVVSTFAYVNSPQMAVFYEQLGASTITIDTNINRHFDLLEAMLDACSCNLKLIVNEGCIYRCPFRDAHSNFCSHTNSLYNPIFSLTDYYHDRCMSMRVKDPSLIIRSGWIRPEDVKVYEKIGFEFFKIGGRGEHTNWIINCMKTYLERSYDGNLMNLLDVPGILRDLFYIPNKELEGAIERWKECKKICHRCNFCSELAERVVRVYSMKGTESEALIPWSSVKAHEACG
ncbi:MAG: U32 family peptidase [Candidatus Syntropharchaeia archaeon]